MAQQDWVVTHIPVQPGWYVCEPVHDDEVIKGFDYVPVVAWEISSNKIDARNSFARNSFARNGSSATCKAICTSVEVGFSGFLFSPDKRFLSDDIPVNSELKALEMYAEQNGEKLSETPSLYFSLL